jgi:hypothetical protein
MRGKRTPAAAAVRALHWKSPPFLIARNLGHERLHALLLGFGETGAAVLSDLLLCSLAGFLGKPCVTVVAPDAAAIHAQLHARTPALADSVDLAFLEAPGTGLDDLLEAAARHAPFTLAHVAPGPDAQAQAAHLQRIAAAHWRMGPIYLAGAEASPDDSPHGAPPIVRYGTAPAPSGRLEGDPDSMARLFHEAYRRTARSGTPANLPWDSLDEEYRESNRRLLTHLPAKLATAGVDVAAWLRSPLPAANAAGGIPLPDIEADPALMDLLAELEHRRWMVDRHLSGWRPGPVRDNDRRIHPDLKPYSELDEPTRDLDRAIVREAWATLGTSTGTGFFPDGGGLGRRLSAAA